MSRLPKEAFFRKMAQGKRVVRKKRHRRHRGRVLFCWLLILLGLGGVGFYFWRMMNSYDYNPLDDSDLGIVQTQQPVSDKITNIALFGVDSRAGENSRSDAMIILSVDPKRGKVKMSSLMRDAYVEIEDHGPGIPPEDLPYIFDRYYRARQDSGKVGTGLGLSITKAILQQHGFAFGVNSAVGQGSTFWFVMRDVRTGPQA